jgi:hypothetical protein
MPHFVIPLDRSFLLILEIMRMPKAPLCRQLPGARSALFYDFV